MTQQIAIGIGCSSRAVGDEVVRLVRSCVVEIVPNGLLATLDRRASIGEFVAKALGLRLILFPASALASIQGTITHSEIALQRVRTSSVAEASALAALGPAARLLVPRQTGSFCTCAVAELP